MRKVIITVVGLAMLTLAVGFPGPGAVADDDGETLTVILENRRAHHVDTDGPGPTPGDYDVITYRLDDRRGRSWGTPI